MKIGFENGKFDKSGLKFNLTYRSETTKKIIKSVLEENNTCQWYKCTRLYLKTCRFSNNFQCLHLMVYPMQDGVAHSRHSPPQRHHNLDRIVLHLLYEIFLPLYFSLKSVTQWMQRCKLFACISCLQCWLTQVSWESFESESSANKLKTKQLYH